MADMDMSPLPEPDPSPCAARTAVMDVKTRAAEKCILKD